MAQTDEWGRAQFARRQRIDIVPGIPGYAASPDDIVLGKMKYFKEGGSEKHLDDMAGILKVSGAKLDRAYLESWISRLGYEEIWAALQQQLSATPPMPA
jgi:hypothetical protein